MSCLCWNVVHVFVMPIMFRPLHDLCSFLFIFFVFFSFSLFLFLFILFAPLIRVLFLCLFFFPLLLFAFPSLSYLPPQVAHQKGIQCRFGARGIIAESHFDHGKNFVLMLRGRKRYLLNPPKACNALDIISVIDHPSVRHSNVDWSDEQDWPKVCLWERNIHNHIHVHVRVSCWLFVSDGHHMKTILPSGPSAAHRNIRTKKGLQCSREVA